MAAGYKQIPPPPSRGQASGFALVRDDSFFQTLDFEQALTAALRTATGGALALIVEVIAVANADKVTLHYAVENGALFALFGFVHVLVAMPD